MAHSTFEKDHKTISKKNSNKNSSSDPNKQEIKSNERKILEENSTRYLFSYIDQQPSQPYFILSRFELRYNRIKTNIIIYSLPWACVKMI